MSIRAPVVKPDPETLPTALRSRSARSRSPRDVNTPTICTEAWRTRTHRYLALRPWLDFTVALVMLIPAAPLMLLAALLIKLTSRGPAFYTQVRVGQNGQLFTIYKLRTMVDNCESLTGPRWSMPGDPRITWLGNLLRETHLDELPQLFNILRGEMSLIGPRPERPEFMPELTQALPRYRERLALRPGVTGLAQVQLPADTDLDSVRRKLTCDLFYIQHVGFWLDVKLFCCTALRALGVPSRWARRLCRVPDLSEPPVTETPVRPRRCA